MNTYTARKRSRKDLSILRRMSGLLLLAALLVLSAQPAVASDPTDVFGTVPAASRGFPSVVILEPANGAPLPVPDEPAIMDQVDKTFTPGVVAARLGQVVEFHNSEDLLHNVHLLNLDSGDTVFNIALPVSGMSHPWTPEEAAVYAVLCDAHPEMEGYVVVADAPHVMVATEDGSFEMTDIPEGAYTLRVWNVEESRSSTKQIQVSGARMEVTAGR